METNDRSCALMMSKDPFTDTVCILIIRRTCDGLWELPTIDSYGDCEEALNNKLMDLGMAPDSFELESSLNQLCRYGSEVINVAIFRGYYMDMRTPICSKKVEGTYPEYCEARWVCSKSSLIATHFASQSIKTVISNYL